MKTVSKKVLRLVMIGALCASLSSCEPPQIYGSVGYSSYSGGYGSSGIGTSVRIGGRIY